MIICSCYRVSSDEIKEAIRSGLKDLESLIEKTEAGSACGCCIDEILTIMEKEWVHPEESTSLMSKK